MVAKIKKLKAPVKAKTVQKVESPKVEEPKDALDELLSEYESIKADIQQLEKTHEGVINMYLDRLQDLQAVGDAIGRYLRDHVADYDGKSVGPFQVGTQRRPDPVAFRKLVPSEVADRYIVYKETLSMKQLEAGLERGEITLEVIESCCTVTPVIKGAPEIKLKKGF